MYGHLFIYKIDFNETDFRNYSLIKKKEKWILRMYVMFNRKGVIFIFRQLDPVFRMDSQNIQEQIDIFLRKHDMKGLRAIVKNSEITNFSFIFDEEGLKSWGHY